MNSTASKRPSHYWPTKILVAVWLLGVLGYAAYRQPEFWKDGVDYYRTAARLASAGKWAEARAPLERALKLSPGTGGYLILKGDIETALGNPAGALAAYQAAFQADASNIEAWFALAGAYERTGTPDKALKLMQRLKPESLTGRDRLRRAKILAQYGQYEAALADLQELLAKQPDEVAVLREMAVLEEAEQRHAAAAGRYETIGRLTGETAELCARIGTLYRWAGQPEAALAWYLKALQQPGAASVSNTAVWGLTAAGVEMSDPRAALPWARQLVADRPGDEAALSLAVRALMKGGAAAEAVAVFDRLAGLRPLTVEERLWQAGQCRQAGDAARAAELLKTLPADQLTGEQRLERLRILTSSGDAEAAIRESERLLAGNPVPEVKRELLGKLAEMNGVLKRYAESADWYGQLAAVEPAADAAREARLARAAALRAAGQADAAYTAYKQDAALENLQARAELAMELRRYEEAEPLLLALVQSPYDPQDDPRMLNDLATVWVMKQDFEKAIPLVQELLNRRWGDAGALTLRLAEMQRWDRQWEAAAKTYRQALGSTGTVAGVATARYGLALTCLAMGQGREALEALAPLLEQPPVPAEYWLAAARGASLTGDAGRAADYLEKLAGLRTLTREEQIWRAGQLRKAGRTEAALALYRELAADPAAERSVLEAYGDLCRDTGDVGGALTAYQRIGGREQDRDLTLKIARAARDSAGNVTLAVALYDDLLKTPLKDIPEIQLEAARFFVNVRREADAYGLYTNAAAVKTWEGRSIELMRAALAANLFAEAEKWARARLDENDQDWHAQLGLVQALHLQGNTHEAAKILDEHKESIAQQPEGLEWLGLVAMARDRHLEAFRIFDQMARDEKTTQRRYWIWRGRAAQALGDRAAAEESYRKAKEFPTPAGEGPGAAAAERQWQQRPGTGSK